MAGNTGYPARLTSATVTETERSIDRSLVSEMLALVSLVVLDDGVHAWLDASDFVNPRTAETTALDSLNGMSGCGCWSIEKGETKLKLFLHAVHTATAMPRLRETPISHHLWLLAASSPAMKSKVTALWPDLPLEGGRSDRPRDVRDRTAPGGKL